MYKKTNRTVRSAHGLSICLYLLQYCLADGISRPETVQVHSPYSDQRYTILLILWGDLTFNKWVKRNWSWTVTTTTYERMSSPNSGLMTNEGALSGKAVEKERNSLKRSCSHQLMRFKFMAFFYGQKEIWYMQCILKNPACLWGYRAEHPILLLSLSTNSTSFFV